MSEPAPVTTEPAITPAPRKRWPVIAAIVAALVIAAAVILFFVLRGGGEKTGPSAETPAFSFKIGHTKAIPTENHADKGKVQSVAQKSASDIRDVLDRMYALAFLDPANWKAGHYDNVFGFFDLGAAQQRAKADADTLTLGPNAGHDFTDVRPLGGTLNVKVLVDQGGHPVSAIADVAFTARATGANKSGEIVVSKGHYFMHILEGGWSVFAYSVARDDRPFTGSGSGSAS